MNRLIRRMAVAAAVVAFHAAPVAAQQDPAAEVRRLFEDAWQHSLRENPIQATMVGDRRFEDRLPSVGEADQQRRAAALRGFLERLRTIDRAALPERDRLDYDLFGRLAEDQLREIEFRSYLMPYDNFAGFHIGLPRLQNAMLFRDAGDFERYTARLVAVLPYVRQHIELMRTGLAEGYVTPRPVLEGWETSIRQHVVEDPSKSVFYAPFETMPERIPVAERERLAAAGRAAVANSVVPAYRELAEFMEREYVPRARADIGASALPNGRDFYAHRVRQFTTLDLTPQQVHEVGLAEVKRIRAEMDSVIRRTGFQGDFAAFVQFLRTDPRFYADTPEQLLEKTALVLKRMDGELPRLFEKLPRTPYGVRPVPDFIAPRMTTAYYSRSPGDGTSAGFYYVNTYDLKSRPLYEVEALSLHEAVPGHHLQIALQQELGEVPPFRRNAGFTAFVEGWALYAESLGKEVGFYTDPYSEFGRLSYDMWRACRLVVDTGIHAMGWTRQQAIDFMAENSALTLHNIAAEVDRYIGWPGQALAYKMGQLKIRELRTRAEQALGPRFDVRAFHAVVLGSGAVPLSVLEANVETWIAGRLHSTS